MYFNWKIKERNQVSISPILYELYLKITKQFMRKLFIAFLLLNEARMLELEYHRFLMPHEIKDLTTAA